MEQKNWWEEIVKDVMAHRTPEGCSWKSCICCGRAFQHLAPKLIAESRRRTFAEVREVVEKLKVQCERMKWMPDMAQPETSIIGLSMCDDILSSLSHGENTNKE